MSYGDEAHLARAKSLGEEPAVACISFSKNISNYGGLTKREEFAKAMYQGLLADSFISAVDWSCEQYSKLSVKHADALLLELTK